MVKKSNKHAAARAAKIKSFDPNGPALKTSNIFGLPFTAAESEIVLLPVPWEVTVSYGGGTSKGPKAIFEASAQVDLYHPEFPDLWKCGIFMEEVDAALMGESRKLKKDAAKVMDLLADGSKSPRKTSELQSRVNKGAKEMVDWVYRASAARLKDGKLLGLVGGDHSTPLGFFKALAEKHGKFGILQIDAHMDLRKAYEGFTYSHASIMYNTLELKEVAKLVQVGIRDYCQEEQDYVQRTKGRVKVFTYADLAAQRYKGMTWKKQCDAIIAALPDKVHISFDIDGLDPRFCPHTGTPVPGGFEFHEITYLLSALARSNKKIISFDLNEVSPGDSDWDGNVGARMLFHLCGVLAKSNKRIK